VHLLLGGLSGAQLLSFINNFGEFHLWVPRKCQGLVSNSQRSKWIGTIISYKRQQHEERSLPKSKPEVSSLIVCR